MAVSHIMGMAYDRACGKNVIMKVTTRNYFKICRSKAKEHKWILKIKKNVLYKICLNAASLQIKGSTEWEPCLEKTLSLILLNWIS